MKLIQVYVNNVDSTLEEKLFCIKYTLLKIYTLFIFLCYLFIHIRTSFWAFYFIKSVNLLNFYNHSKTSASKKLKILLRKYHPRFAKVCKNKSDSSSNRLDINQFLVLLYDCVLNLKQH